MRKLIALLLLCACATTTTSPKSSSASLAQIANDYWQHVLEQSVSLQTW